MIEESRRGPRRTHRVLTRSPAVLLPLTAVQKVWREQTWRRRVGGAWLSPYPR